MPSPREGGRKAVSRFWVTGTHYPLPIIYYLSPITYYQESPSLYRVGFFNQLVCP